MSRCTVLALLLVAAGCSGGPAAAPSDLASAPADGGASDTWTTFAQPWFQTYCVECHSPGGADPSTGDKDFTQYASVMKYAAPIRCGVAVTQDPSWSCASSPAAEQFPVSDATGTNPKPTDAERTRLVDWISAGLPR